MMDRTLPGIAVFASGNGSNAINLIERCLSGDLSAHVVCCVTDNLSAPVVSRTLAHGVPVLVYDFNEFATKDEYEAHIVRDLRMLEVELIVLAGYMRICGPVFLQAFQGMTINLHPSLLPAFPGKDAIGAALEAGVPATGVSVHVVDAGVDTGPVIVQQRVTILPGESRESLTRRIQRVEHELLPLAVSRVLRVRDTAKRRFVKGSNQWSSVH